MHFLTACKLSASLSGYNISDTCILQETELDRFQAPEEAAAEEDKLRAEREAKEKQQIKVSTEGMTWPTSQTRL